MLCDVRMIGRAVDREIERDLHSARRISFWSQSKSSERAELRLDVLVSAAVRAFLMTVADGVWNARFARLAGHGVVAAFAIREADRMDRREINHVESHRLRVIDSRQAIAKGRTPVAAALRRAREKFIPGRRARFALDRRSHEVRGAYCVALERSG